MARSDHILVPSHATKQDLVDILAVEPQKITVNQEGVEACFRPLSRAETASTIESLGLPQEYILFLGTIEPRKNLVGLASAYLELLLQLPDLPKLVIAGRPGWHYEQLMNDIANVGLGERLIFANQIADDQLPALYNHALVLVTPSFYEGFGLPALEAMACGTVPIVSNVASLPEIVGDVGILIDPHDIGTIASAIKRCLSDSRWRESQSVAGIERAKQFRWQETAATVQQVYQAVLS